MLADDPVGTVPGTLPMSSDPVLKAFYEICRNPDSDMNRGERESREWLSQQPKWLQDDVDTYKAQELCNTMHEARIVSQDDREQSRAQKAAGIRADREEENVKDRYKERAEQMFEEQHRGREVSQKES